MFRFSFVILGLSLLFLSSCALYKLDVQQGNVVTQDMLNKLQPNMPTEKVLFVMGNPLIVDVFHRQQRWDYLYSVEEQGKGRQQRRISLFFKENHLIAVDGDVKIGQGTSPTQPILEDTEEKPIL
jgi:outer membrane protein assembly factor BamE